MLICPTADSRKLVRRPALPTCLGWLKAEVWPAGRRLIQLSCLVAIGLSYVPPAAADEPTDEELFVEQLYPQLLAAQCNLCHNDNGVASETEIEFPDANANREQILALGYQLLDLIDAGEPTRTWLYIKPTNIEEHSGGQRIEPGSEQAALLVRWIRHLQSLTADEIAEARAKIEEARRFELQPLTLRRLTHSQYNHTVRDLLGDLSQPADDFPPEDFVGGFKNQMAGGRVSPLLAEAYGQAAERLARRAFRGGDALGLFPVEISLENRETIQAFVEDFGLKAFRRPLESAEVARYRRLFEEVAAARGDVFEGGRIVVESMLQSPNFLFLVERGPGGPYKPYELASRLSYFLWDTMPSDELLRKAEAGELRTVSQIENVARQMLGDPRAKAAMEEFLAQWLRFDRVLTATRDRRKFRDFTPELAAAMVEETSRLFNHLVWGEHNFMEFFTAAYTFPSSGLAELYGLPRPEIDFARVDYPPDSSRAGVLGHASFLVATSKPTETSPTERGLFVRNHFLGQTVPAPPPGVNTSLPEITEDQPMTNRQRLELHLNSDACASCHRLIDPIGMGFEQFNPIGKFEPTVRFRVEADEGDDSQTGTSDQPEVLELEIDATGHIQGIRDSEFSSPKELAHLLAKSEVCQRCVVKQLFRYAFGRQETFSDQEIIDGLLDKFKSSEFRFTELILALVTSDLFLQQD